MYDDIQLENIHEQETIDCIEIFNEELNAFLNKAPDFSATLLEKYTKQAPTNNNGNNEILLQLSKEGRSAVISFKEDFFDDYCYSNRKERDTILKEVLNQIKEKLK